MGRIVSFAAAIVVVALAGCAGTPAPTSGLVKPASRCMKSGAIPRPKLGEESTAYSARLIDHAKSEASKQACLQRWARTVAN